MSGRPYHVAGPLPPNADRSFSMDSPHLCAASVQGRTVFHFSAQPQPFWSHLLVSPCLLDWVKIMRPTYPTKCAYGEPKSGGRV